MLHAPGAPTASHMSFSLHHQMHREWAIATGNDYILYDSTQALMAKKDSHEFLRTSTSKMNHNAWQHASKCGFNTIQQCIALFLVMRAQPLLKVLRGT